MTKASEIDESSQIFSRCKTSRQMNVSSRGGSVFFRPSQGVDPLDTLRLPPWVFFTTFLALCIVTLRGKARNFDAKRPFKKCSKIALLAFFFNMPVAQMIFGKRVLLCFERFGKNQFGRPIFFNKFSLSRKF